MGASSSTEQKQIPEEQRQVEAEAASSGALPLLRKAFSKLADPSTNSIPPSILQQYFLIEHRGLRCEGGTTAPGDFLGILDLFGLCAAEFLFSSQMGGISWVEFVRGYIRCCGRVSASSLLNALFRVFASSADRAGYPPKLRFDDIDGANNKASGSISPKEMGMLLCLCWVMSLSPSRLRGSEGGEMVVPLPDVNHLILSAVLSCSEKGYVLNQFDMWDSDVSSLEVQLDVTKIHMWALRTVPNLSSSFSQFIHARIERAANAETAVEVTSSSADDNMPTASTHEYHLLTCGRAWAISLSLRSSIRDEIQSICFASSTRTYHTLLYRSSHHGKGLNRFWSGIEGYHAPMLLLISASSSDVSRVTSIDRRWMIGVLTEQGFENKDVYYGSGGNLYAICPIFQRLSPSGKEKNFVYSHLHSTGKVYEPHPKPVGIAFGGSIGNERIFIEEDFSKITIRHHAMDKTYQPGSLIPNQGFLPIEAAVLDVEVWGLGGKAAEDQQISYKKREELFTEQRRKVDLKTFTSWEDSPEKMMMDMMGDPNRARREDR